MSDVWSRAWCETQNVPNFALKGNEKYFMSDNFKNGPKIIFVKNYVKLTINSFRSLRALRKSWLRQKY